jgi:hypothetical protein
VCQKGGLKGAKPPPKELKVSSKIQTIQIFGLPFFEKGIVGIPPQNVNKIS